MSPSILLYTAAGLLSLGALGHTLGGMFGMASRGPAAGPEADRVLAEMRAVHFSWRGAADVPARQHLLPLAWACGLGLAGISAVGVRYFPLRIGVIFGLIAALTLGGAAMITASA